MRSNGIKREVSPVSQLFLLREKTPESVLVEIVTKSPTVLTYAKLMMHQVDSNILPSLLQAHECIFGEITFDVLCKYK